MAVLQINQIVKRIHDTYDDLLDFSDIKGFNVNKPENANIAVARGLNAYVIKFLTGCTEEDAASSVTDSGDDNGIDAIFYDEVANCLYVTQSKYDQDGKGEPDLGSVKKFIGGFKDLIEMRFEKFCTKIKRRQTEIESILDRSNLNAKLLLIYTGVNKGQKNIEEFEQITKELNDLGQNWVSYEFFTQKELYEILTKASSSSIDVDLMINNFGFVDGNPKAFYGQMAISDIGELWKKYGSSLFAANIRNLLAKSDINDGMLNTLKNNAHLFWFYNGITIICDRIEKKKIGGSSRGAGTFEVKNLSIVNGAQTTGTIGAYYSSMTEDEAERLLADSYVQVKIIQTKDEDGNDVEEDLSKNITVNNNMQNKIISRDFASQTSLQKRFKTELDQEGITYHISRGDDEASNATHFSISEAGRARCNTLGIKYVMIAHRGINTHLFKDMESNEYKAAFNENLTGIELWNTVLLQRAIDEALQKERKANPEIRDILVYGKDFLSYLFLRRKKISKTTVMAVTEDDKTNIREFVAEAANSIAEHIKQQEKTTRNYFQSGVDVESLYNALRDST